MWIQYSGRFLLKNFLIKLNLNRILFNQWTLWFILAFVGSLLAERQEAALEQLLVHLPLLRPGNSEARGRYLAAVHHVLGHCVESGRHVEAARQLLSYSLIHPAMGTEDRRALAKWLRHLEERIAHAGAAAAAALGVTSECTSQLPDTCHRWIHPMVHSCSSVPTINSKSNLIINIFG